MCVDIYTDKAAKDRHRTYALFNSNVPVHVEYNGNAAFWSCVMNSPASKNAEQRTDSRDGFAPSKSLFLPGPASLPLEINLFGLPFSNPLVSMISSSN